MTVVDVEVLRREAAVKASLATPAFAERLNAALAQLAQPARSMHQVRALALCVLADLGVDTRGVVLTFAAPAGKLEVYVRPEGVRDPDCWGTSANA